MQPTISLFSEDQAHALIKYPRTPHLEGSRLQVGDTASDQTPYAALQGQSIVVEEKLDGGNCAISFDAGGNLQLQSRGHYLTGGGRERQFNLFKRWAVAHEAVFLERLEDRYVLYGEWMHKKHSVFYDALPHYFLEFDIWDRQTAQFLSTPARQQRLQGCPVVSVPVLYAGITPRKQSDLLQWVQPSLARTAHWRQAYEKAAAAAGLTPEAAWKLADKSDLSEGLYLKVEQEGKVCARYKWVRADFVQAILDTGKHHAEQPFVANQLHPSVDIYAPERTCNWPDLSSTNVCSAGDAR